MPISIEQFRARFPEFSDETEYPDTRVQLFIDDSIAIYMGEDEKRWGGKYSIAQSYLVAHLLIVAESQELGDTNTKSGPISSKSAGGVSVTRAVVAVDRSDSDNYLMSSSYGQQYINIRNLCFVGVLVAK